MPSQGVIEMQLNGVFKYTPSVIDCSRDQFTYKVCDLTTGECDTAMVSLSYEDNSPPNLTNIPSDFTMSCDEQIPEFDLISSFDNCPRIRIDATESSNQGEDGCSLYDYTMIRSWTATDFCQNQTTATQIIKIEDKEAPNIFRIYELPNGKKMVAGVAALTGKRWKTVSLPIDFETIPLIFNQIISTNNTTTPLVRTRGVSKNQFEIRLQKEESDTTKYVYEQVAWMAIEAGIQNADYSLRANCITTDKFLEEINFTTPFSSIPVFFTNLQTANNQNIVTTLCNSPKFKDNLESIEIFPTNINEILIEYCKEYYYQCQKCK